MRLLALGRQHWGAVITIEAQERIYYDVAKKQLFQRSRDPRRGGVKDGSLGIPSAKLSRPGQFWQLGTTKGGAD